MVGWPVNSENQKRPAGKEARIHDLRELVLNHEREWGWGVEEDGRELIWEPESGEEVRNPI